MMHLKFPLPAGYFPKFELTPDETLAYKELVTDLVKDTRREYESYVTTQQRHVDGRKWKLAKSKDKLHFYKRRSEYGATAIGLTGRGQQNPNHGRHGSASSSGGGSFDLRSESESSSAFSQSTASGLPSHPRSRDASARSRVGSMSSSRSGSTTDGDTAATAAMGGNGLNRRLLEPTLLATGVLEGSVDDMVYAFHEPTADDTKGLDALMGGDSLVDAVVLHTIKCTKTTYLGLKWKLCRTPGGNRDFCFLEYVGVANDAKGQRYGFKVLESVKLRNCPPFADNSIIRTDVSFCYLFRESGSPGIVDVYMHGAFDSSGDAVTAGGVGDARSTMDMLLDVEKCVEIAEAKKLAALVAKQAAAPPRPKNGSALCSICRAKPGMLSSHMNCQGCGGVICTKCRMKKTVMATKRGVATKVKISCCKICLVNAKETSPFEGEPINTQPPLRALTKKASTGNVRSASIAEDPKLLQPSGLESTHELALALPVATSYNSHQHQHQLHHHQQQQQMLPYQHHQHQKPMERARTAGSLTETEFSGSMQSWQSSSVSSSYSDLDDSYGSPPNGQLVVAMPAVAEHNQHNQQHRPQYGYASLADGTMVAAPPGSHGMGTARRLAPPPPPMHAQGPNGSGGPPDMNQHRMGLYNQMLELQMQAERAYNLANQNNATFMQRQ